MWGLFIKLACAALGIAVGVVPSSAQIVSTTALSQEQPWNFSKQAFDANGAPFSGPVAVGQTINYVLSYQPGGSASGPVTITDTLSPNLSYVNPSISAPPGWSWTMPPYNIGNSETYSNPGIGPGMAFTLNVPVGDAAATGTTGGDGTLPIPVGNRLYGVFHHMRPGNAKIMCWELATLATCTGGGWPRLLGSDLMTTTMLRHVAVGTRIYFPSARVTGIFPPDGTTTTTPIIGCWDTASEIACPSLPLPSGPVWTGDIDQSNAAIHMVDPLMGGIASDAAQGRLLVYAADSFTEPTTALNGRVYCVPLGGSCAGWSSPTNFDGTRQTFFTPSDMMLEEVASGTPNRLFFGHGGRLSCVNLINGSSCWGSTLEVPPTPVAHRFTLSPVLDAAGNTVQVCVHAHPTGLPDCYDASTGAAWSQSSWSAGFSSVMAIANTTHIATAPFRIPGTSQVIYPGWDTSQLTSIFCFDFSTDAACSSFAPGWTPSNHFEDYGYVVDPLQPENCLIGLGNKGIPWRFTRTGGFGDKGCSRNIKATFNIDSFFCSVKPTDPAWQTVEIIGRPVALAGGTITLMNSVSTVVGTITVGSANTYPVGLPATGANSQLTLQFTPTYTGVPTAGYQLRLTFQSDVDPQICYKATVKKCGPVSNSATMAAAGPAAQDKAVAKLNFGEATGDACTPGLLKICKIAGPGITVGTPFDFNAGSSSITVPAGPAPGGTCVVGPSLPVGSAITVSEFVPSGVTVTNINVAPPSQQVGLPNLGGGSVNITMGTGVTEVTFTNNLTGYIEICKKGDVKGNFSFTISPGSIGPVVVPAGACSPAIQVIAGPVIVKEVPKPGSAMSGCSTWPASQQLGCNTSAGTSTVNVSPGNISTMTIAFIENKRL
jgi:hypothetical protein